MNGVTHSLFVVGIVAAICGILLLIFPTVMRIPYGILSILIGLWLLGIVWKSAKTDKNNRGAGE